MKARIIVLVLASLLLITATACAAPRLNEKLFARAKNALCALAEGDYARAVTELPFSDVSPDADEWRGFARGSFSTLDDPQTKYAVAYWSGSRWKIAVPLHMPDSAGVEVFVLSSQDGSSISGYSSASWGSVQSEFRSADYVIWRDEYGNLGTGTVAYDN